MKSVLKNRQDRDESYQAVILKHNNTDAMIELLEGLRNLECQIEENVETFQEKHGAKNLKYQMLDYRQKSQMVLRIYKDIGNNLKHVMSKDNCVNLLSECNDPFWISLRSKKMRAQQIKNMEYNNILKHQRVELVDQQILKKRTKIAEQREGKFGQLLEYCAKIKQMAAAKEADMKRGVIREMEEKGFQKLALDQFFGNFLLMEIGMRMGVCWLYLLLLFGGGEQYVIWVFGQFVILFFNMGGFVYFVNLWTQSGQDKLAILANYDIFYCLEKDLDSVRDLGYFALFPYLKCLIFLDMLF